MKQNINEVLLNHFNNNGGAAGYLRGLIPNIGVEIEKLFSTRSDIKRVQIAESLAEKILEITDFKDLVPLRSEVATLEIKRMINYDKQTDHTAHTVYLFLLGIWIYDNIPILRNEVDEFIKSDKKVKMFIFQWIFSSLLHDIGYLFFNYVDGDNKLSWNKFDQMFEIEHIKNYLGNRVEKNKIDFNKICNEFINDYKDALVHSNYTNPSELLEQLNNIPWLEYIIGKKQLGIELLIANNDLENKLIEFSQDIATNGYPGGKNKPQVDHAIASGLMLLKYTSMWYWIYMKAMEQYSDLYRELSSIFRYPKEVFIKHVIPACRATIYHNITELKCSYNEEPLLYLEILCDELQLWDRFWSGSTYIEKWKDIDHCMAEEVYAEIIYNEIQDNQLHFVINKDEYNKIYNSMQKRLKAWDKVLKLSLL